MSNLLTPGDQAEIKDAIQQAVDTFFRWPVIVNSKNTVPGAYGESPLQTVQHRTFYCYVDMSVGKSGRYQDIDKTELGQRDEDSFHIFFWQDDILNSGIVINPESDTVTIAGIPDIHDGEYEIRLFSPTALFSDLGFLLYDMEVKIYGG